MSEAAGTTFQGDAHRKRRRWWQSPPIEWWKRHPWIVWWVNLVLLPLLVPYLFDISDLLGRIFGLDDPSSGRMVVISIFLVIFAVVFCSSVVQGLRVSWRKEISPMRVVRVLILWMIIGILVAIAVPLYQNIGGNSRLLKAQADVDALAAAVRQYSAHMDSLPTNLTDLMLKATNSKGQTAGPFFEFFETIPSPPFGWTDYRYESRADGTYVITTSDGVHTITADSSREEVTSRAHARGRVNE